jgi:hypothetical protein
MWVQLCFSGGTRDGTTEELWIGRGYHDPLVTHHALYSALCALPVAPGPWDDDPACLFRIEDYADFDQIRDRTTGATVIRCRVR